jgi:hypothetical protein
MLKLYVFFRQREYKLSIDGLAAHVSASAEGAWSFRMHAGKSYTSKGRANESFTSYVCS